MFGLAVLLACLVAGVSSHEQPILTSQPPAQGEFHGHNHGTTVCIEIRPPGHSSAPTRVCGPVVHGGQQPEQQLKEQQPPLQGEVRAAAPPCAGRPGYPPFYHDMARMVPPQPALWRQSMPAGNPAVPPPCDHPHQRSSVPPTMPAWGGAMPVFGMPMIPPPMPLARAWYGPQGKSAGGEEARESSDADPMMMEDEVKTQLNYLLDECNKKSKLIQEKDAEIQKLLNDREAKEKIPGPGTQPKESQKKQN